MGPVDQSGPMWLSRRGPYIISSNGDHDGCPGSPLSPVPLGSRATRACRQAATEMSPGRVPGTMLHPRERGPGPWVAGATRASHSTVVQAQGRGPPCFYPAFTLPKLAELQGLQFPSAHGLGRPCPLGLGVPLPPPGSPTALSGLPSAGWVGLPLLSGPPPRRPLLSQLDLQGVQRLGLAFRLSWAPASLPTSPVLGPSPSTHCPPSSPDGPPVLQLTSRLWLPRESSLKQTVPLPGAPPPLRRPSVPSPS